MAGPGPLVHASLGRPSAGADAAAAVLVWGMAGSLAGGGGALVHALAAENNRETAKARVISLSTIVIVSPRPSRTVAGRSYPV